MRVRLNSSKGNQNGFSLIEMVIGITTFAVALTIVTATIIPQASKSVDPIHQVRATELAQSLFNEILGKYYDSESDKNGGRIRCNEDLANDFREIECTEPELLGPDGQNEYLEGLSVFDSELGFRNTNRAAFDDVDDYNLFIVTKDDPITNSLGEELRSSSNSGGSDLYADFSFRVDVFYDADFDGVPDTVSGNVKQIKVTVTTPTDSSIVFSSFKHNY